MGQIRVWRDLASSSRESVEDKHEDGQGLNMVRGQYGQFRDLCFLSDIGGKVIHQDWRKQRRE